MEAPLTRRGTLGVAAANLVGRVTGLARDIVMAAVFGAGVVSDAYNIALRVPQIFRELLAEGSLQNIVVPAFASTSEKEGAEAAWRLANAFLGVLLLVLGACTLTFWVGAPFWVRLLADAFSADAAKFALTVDLTRWMSPFLAGLSLAALAAGLLNVRGRFFVPALSTSLLNLLVIAACFLTEPFERLTGRPGIVGVALATTLSGFAQLAVLMPGLWREGYRPRPTLRGHPALARSAGFFGAALIGIGTVQFNLLVESQWAASYGDGVVTWLLGSFRLVQLPLTLFAGSIATTLLPALSMQIARDDRAAASEVLTDAFRLHAWLVLPSAAALFVLAEPLTALFYERGAFTAKDTAGTAAMLRMYAVAAFGICFHRLAVPACYALGNARGPMWLAAMAMAAKVPVVLLFTRGFGMGPDALPLSHAVTVTGECIGLTWILRSRLHFGALAITHARSLFAAIGLGGVAWALAERLPVLVVCAIAGIAYIAIAGRPPRRAPR